MDQAARSDATRRGMRCWRWCVVVACILPLGVFGVSNLCLTSPWGRAWVAGRINQRSGLQVAISAASWSPWNGLTLREITVEQPPELRATISQPLLHIGVLRIIPVWRSCFRGRFEIRNVELESPRLVLALQMMSQLAQQATAPAAEPAIPPVAAQLPTAEPPAQITPPTAVPPTAVPPTAAPPAAALPAKLPPKTPPQPTKWLRLRHASCLLITAGDTRPLLEINDLTSDLPLIGDAAQSALRMADLKVRGTPLISGLDATLGWQEPVLSLNPVATTIAGIKLQFAGKLALLKGLPMQLEVQVPKQSPPPLELTGGGAIKAAQFASHARFRGLLMAPGSWQGDCVTEASAISIQHGGQQAMFDSASCTTVLRGGVLSCVDVRGIGDALSLMGNATLLADGRIAGVLRLIAAPETIIDLVKRMFPDIDPAPYLTPLSTPQRAAFDLEAFGVSNAIQIRLGQNGPVLPLP
jgi:hypothetical protein